MSSILQAGFKACFVKGVTINGLLVPSRPRCMSLILLRVSGSGSRGLMDVSTAEDGAECPVDWGNQSAIATFCGAVQDRHLAKFCFSAETLKQGEDCMTRMKVDTICPGHEGGPVGAAAVDGWDSGGAVMGGFNRGEPEGGGVCC